MVKVFSSIILGILFTILGFYCIFTYVNTTQKIGTPVLLFAGIIATMGGLILLFLATRLQRTHTIEQKQEIKNAAETVEKKTLFEKQSEMVSQWNKTMDTRDRLKLLKIQAAAQASKD